MEGAARPYPVKRWSASRSEEEPCIRITEQNRGADGLWRGYRPEEVASPEAWRRDRRKFRNNTTCACDYGLGDWGVCRTVGPAIA